jgi:Peptidase family M48
MKKSIAAAATAVVYIAGASWVVHSEGVAYRRALREARAVAGTRPAPAIAGEPAGPDPVAADRPLTPAPPTTTHTPAPVEQQVKTPAPHPARKKTRPATPRESAASDSLALKPAEPAPQAPRRHEPEAGPKGDPIWDQPPQKKVWDLSALKPADEMRLGRDLHDLIVHLNPPLRDGPWLRRVEEAAAPLLEARTRKEIGPYSFTILDSDRVNAFSHPGGYIYLNRGLFDMIGDDEDYALRFVLAHEIAHVDRQHALACLRDPAVAKSGAGTLAQFYALIFPWGYYPDAIDFDADRWAYGQLIRLDHSPRESLAFLRKLEGYAKANGFENGRMPPPEEKGPEAGTGAGASLVDNHYRAHPAAWKRLQELRKLAVPASSPATAPVTPAAARPTR